jgi:N-methylhydantoinase A
MAYQIGIDTGGTFTDFVMYDREGRRVEAWKTLSTPGDPIAAILTGLGQVPQIERIESIRVGSTLATNALLEQRGAVVGYVTTKGFRDVPFIQRGNRRSHYDLSWQKPKPFCKRRHSYEVSERLDARGRILQALDEAEVRRLAQAIRREGEVEAVAVNLLFSYLSPAHERRIKDIFQEEVPEIAVSISYDLVPKWKEDQRASTTIADAYIKPLVRRQLADMERRLRDRGVKSRVVVIRSNGSEMSLAAAAAAPVHLTVSGPTGGVIAAKRLAQACAIRDLVTLDIGGTSTDVSTIVDGEERFTTDFELQFGQPIRIPMIDIRTIGAGGGSIARLDKAGMLHVGPESAGANPGPACYGFGGTEATVTDANLLLGRISADNFLGGRMRLDVLAARAAVERIARPIRLPVEEAALAIIRIANNNMVGALRAVLIERGYDPRDFTLLNFGGAGPLHLGDLMHDANIPRGMVPNHPAQFSAYGFTMTDARVDRHRSVLLNSRHFDLERGNVVMEELGQTALAELSVQGYVDRIALSRVLDMRYLGQNYELEVPIDFERFSPATAAQLWQRFHERYEQRYQFKLPGETIEIVDIKVTALSETVKPDLPELPRASGPAQPVGQRTVVFEDGRAEASIYDRASLRDGHEISGPAVIEEAASATVLRPDHRLRVDRLGNLHLSS